MNKTKKRYIAVFSAIFAVVVTMSAFLPVIQVKAEDVPSPGTETVTYTRVILPSNANTGLVVDNEAGPFNNYYCILDILPFTYLDYKGPGNFDWFFPSYVYDDYGSVSGDFEFVSVYIDPSNIGNLNILTTFNSISSMMGLSHDNAQGEAPDGSSLTYTVYNFSNFGPYLMETSVRGLSNSYDPSVEYGTLQSITTSISQSDAIVSNVRLTFNYDNGTSWYYSVLYEVARGFGSIWYSAGDLTVNVSELSNVSYEMMLQQADAAYKRGVAEGEAAGKIIGRNEGFAEAEELYKNVGELSFFNLISAVIDVPVIAFTNLTNFDFLGVNIFAFLTAILTIGFIVAIFRIVRR